MKPGYKLTAAFSANGLPAWVRWSNPHTNLGEVTFTTNFSGYGSYDGLLLPLGYDTHLGWRNIDYLKLYVDTYQIDSGIADPAAPQQIRNSPEPPDHPISAVTSVPVAKGIWRIDLGGTSVIEFKDHTTLFEPDANPEQAKAVIAYARTWRPENR